VRVPTRTPLSTVICAGDATGVILVAAAGNDTLAFDQTGEVDEDDGTPLPRYTPAAYPEVLAVTAMSDTDGEPGAVGPRGCSGEDVRAPFSNFAATATGRAHTIAAPGSCITSTALGGGTTIMGGTSMAAPHVAGLAALCHAEGGVAGVCAGPSAADNRALLLERAAARAAEDPGFGFLGDLLRPDPAAPAGAHFGHLVWGGADLRAPAVTLLAPVDGTRATDTMPSLAGGVGTAPGDEPSVLVEVFSGSSARAWRCARHLSPWPATGGPPPWTGRCPTACTPFASASATRPGTSGGRRASSRSTPPGRPRASTR
jgi:hypothetical protein